MPDRGRPNLVLSIDGGGVRGLVPAMILQKLEEELQNRQKTKPIGSYFRLISGTSTGGIIALGLCTPKKGNPTKPACTPSELVELYKSRSKEIFGALKNFSFFGFRPTNKYDCTSLESMLEEMLGDALTSDALYNFLVTAYDIERRWPRLYSNIQPNGQTPPCYFAKHLARATAAAPTFFDPAKIPKLHGASHFESLMDGGIFAANPSMVTLMHMVKMGWDIENIKMLSLGTGLSIRAYFYDDVKKWGNLNWVLPNKGIPIVSMLLQSQANIADDFMNLIYNKDETDIKNKRYLRIDARLPLTPDTTSTDELDNTTSDNIKNLEIFADHLLEDPDNRLILEHIADIA